MRVYNKMHIEMKQEVWWVQSLIIVWVIKHNDMHAPVALQKLAIAIGYRLFGF